MPCPMKIIVGFRPDNLILNYAIIYIIKLLKRKQMPKLSDFSKNEYSQEALGEANAEVLRVADTKSSYEDEVRDVLCKHAAKAGSNELQNFAFYFGPVLDAGDPLEEGQRLIYKIQAAFLDHLYAFNAIHALEFITEEFDSDSINYTEVAVAKIKFYPKKLLEYFDGQKTIPTSRQLIRIRKVYLNDDLFTVVINEDEYISFRSKKTQDNKGGRSARETQAFKIFSILWEYRQEIKKGKAMRDSMESNAVSKDQLMLRLHCTENAARSAIRRINEKFADRHIPIKVVTTGTGLYRIRVNLG